MKNQAAILSTSSTIHSPAHTVIVSRRLHGSVDEKHQPDSTASTGVCFAAGMSRLQDPTFETPIETFPGAQSLAVPTSAISGALNRFTDSFYHIQRHRVRTN